MTFRVTFGVQYAVEPHPLGWPHPDGWLTVVAPDERTARALVVAVFGTTWSNIYDVSEGVVDWDRFHPWGELARIDFTIGGADAQPAG